MNPFSTLATCLALAAGSWRGFAAASPLSPEQELGTFQIADSNLVVELAAAEPDVRAPVAIAWDADGRMFVAEMTDYPSGPVNGRIRLLEDRDGDGRYERSTIFATNLAFPNGVMAWKNGVLVTAAPDIWFLADTNGDGVADVREKILTGFAEGNQQLRVNGLYWGLDNWIYGCNGRSDGEVKWADGTPAGSIRRHDFRFRPDTKQFEVIAGNSQFGMGHDDWGNRFPVFNNTPVRHVVLEDRYLARQPSLAGTDNVPSISPATDGNRVFALTPPTLLIPQPVGFFTSACGPSIFRGTGLPESYRGNYFVCEPVQNLVQRRVLKPNGSTFLAEYADASGSPLPPTGRGVRGEGWDGRDASENANASPRSHSSPTIPLPVEGRGKPEAASPKEFLASTDRWFHGVFTATGPDGAFYIVDFYRDLVEHPHWVAPEIRDKVDWRKGEEHGRIWRVRVKDAKPAKAERLSEYPDGGLVHALKSPNGWVRDTAHRLLVERRATNVVRVLENVARGGATPQSRVHALHVLVDLSPRNMNLLIDALQDTDPRVRERAVAIIEPVFRSGAWHGSTQVFEDLQRNMFARCDDADARVRLAAACSWSATIFDTQKFSALARVVRRGDFDFWQSLPALVGAGDRAWPLLAELKALLENGTEEQLQLLTRLSASVAGSKATNDVTQFSAWLAQSRSSNRFALAAAFIEALPREERDHTIWQVGGPLLLRDATMACASGSVPLGVRLAAIRLLDVTRSTDAAPALRSLISREPPEPVQVAATRALIEWGDPYARQGLEQWPVSSKPARRQMLASSLKAPNTSLALLDFVESGRVSKPEIDPPTRQALQKHRDPTVATRAKMIFAEVISADREAVVVKYRAALNLAGDRARGAAVFERTCVVCHQMQGVGAKVGPDLSGIGQHARETLLVDILDPSRQVLPDFVSYTATLKNGESVTGFIASESATTVTLRRANEPDATLVRAELKNFRTESKSLMPDGLEAGMSEQDVADLIEFLRRPDRTLFSQSK